MGIQNSGQTIFSCLMLVAFRLFTVFGPAVRYCWVMVGSLISHFLFSLCLTVLLLRHMPAVCFNWEYSVSICPDAWLARVPYHLLSIDFVARGCCMRSIDHALIMHDNSFPIQHTYHVHLTMHCHTTYTLIIPCCCR